jgi:hypothetical protein
VFKTKHGNGRKISALNGKIMCRLMYLFYILYIYIYVYLPIQYNAMLVDQKADWEADLKILREACPELCLQGEGALDS